MNPVDHPHGGGEGKPQAVEAPYLHGVSQERFKNTKTKRSDKYIINRRKKRN